MVLSIDLKISQVKNGIATVYKTCWGCGEFHEEKIPLDDIGTEYCASVMCNDCVIKFCSESTY
ncbi:hypothetical protein C4565_00625 [Candidatus Parcubacteria bacterium]|nr:MAG: hypothetical protein C4565_00625 [Candidatus Parcubacteria bacterium]